MAFEAIKAEISLLMSKLGDESHDRQELEFLLREKINALKAFGMPIPEDLSELEKLLDSQLEGEAKASARHTDAK